jgi:hypothetical protein
VTSQAVGAYYGILSNRYEARSRASSMQHAAEMEAFNARQSELDAQQAITAGEQEMGRVGLQYALLKGQQLASQSARGTVVGVGSNAEVLAATEYARQADQITIDANSVRAAQAARRRGLDQTNRGRMLMVSAANERGFAKALSPGLAAATAAIAGGGAIAGQWADREERRGYYSRGTS